jgi:hypothetical protein
VADDQRAEDKKSGCVDLTKAAQLNYDFIAAGEAADAAAKIIFHRLVGRFACEQAARIGKRHAAEAMISIECRFYRMPAKPIDRTARKDNHWGVEAAIFECDEFAIEANFI